MWHVYWHTSFVKAHQVIWAYAIFWHWRAYFLVAHIVPSHGKQILQFIDSGWMCAEM